MRLISKDALGAYMEASGLSIRDLARRAGSESYRPKIGHLRSGKRTTCGPKIAGAIDKALGAPPGSPFLVEVANAGTVPLIAIHTYECPRESGERALCNRATYQQTSGTCSYTVLVSADGKSLRADDDNYIPCASLPTGDRLGFHLSFLAYASDSRETWLKHDAQLREAGRICAQWCRDHGHEVRRLSVPEVQSRRDRGFCSHGDTSAAFRESTHTDPGPNFPWDVFLRYVTEESEPASAPEEDDMFTGEDRTKLDRVQHELTYLFESRYEDPATGKKSTFKETLVGYVLEFNKKLESINAVRLPAPQKALDTLAGLFKKEK